MKVRDLTGQKRLVITLDFETYYDKEYNLSKQTMTTYVRDPKFKVQCVGIKFGDEPTQVYFEDIERVLNAIAWENIALCCHNTSFDALILTQVYKCFPAYYLDTASMSRGLYGVTLTHTLKDLAIRTGAADKLGNKMTEVLTTTQGKMELTQEEKDLLSQYCARDVDLTYEAFKAMYLRYAYPTKELHIIDITIRAFVEPKLLVNHALCEEEIAEEQLKTSELLKKVGVNPKDLASNPKFAQLLADRGIDPPTKISPTTGKVTWALAKNDLEFQNLLKDERVYELIQARLAVKSRISETRAYRLIEHSRPTLPIGMTYCGAHTHRWSGMDSINPQNLSAGRNGKSDRLRRAIQAPPGYKLVIVDSGQIEARCAAYMAGELSLLKVFRDGGDPYIELASAIFGRPITKADKQERNVGKMGELSFQFGVGWKKFHYAVNAGTQGTPYPLTEDQARKAVRSYRANRPFITGFWNILDTVFPKLLDPAMEDSTTIPMSTIRYQKIEMPNKLFLHYPGLKGSDDGDSWSYQGRNGRTHLYGAKLFENIVQSVARTIIAEQVLEIAKKYPHIVLLVHDEVVVLVREDQADECLDYALQCFQQPPAWAAELPLSAEGTISPHYLK